MTYYSNKLPLEIWPFQDHRATGGCGQFQGFASFGSRWRQRALLFGLFKGVIFAEATIVRQCAKVARLFVFDFLPMGNKLRELKTLQ